MATTAPYGPGRPAQPGPAPRPHLDYGGSTGYGRAYRRRLHGNWGVVDTEDCINAARHLVPPDQARPGGPAPELPHSAA